MPIFNLRSIKHNLAHRTSPPLDPVTKIPLTERNIDFFNSKDKTKEEEDFIYASSKHARDRIQRAREIQVSEWLRLLP